MTEVKATVGQATEWTAERTVPGRARSPVYRALAPSPTPGPRPDLGDAELDLLHRQLTARALMVIAVSSGTSTRRARFALDPAGPSAETSQDEAPSRWSAVGIHEIPRAISELLGAADVEPAPPRLTVEGEAEPLRLTPQQNATARAALEQGAGPEEAYVAVPGLDDRLLDALTAAGPRISLTLVLHDPDGVVAERPVSFSRLWVTGLRGMYRVDTPDDGGGAIYAVDEGDVLGTALPLLEEGMRFAAACAASGGAR